MKSARLIAGNARFICDVGKCSLSIIAVKTSSAISSHKEIGNAVVVEITPDASKPVPGSRYSGLFSDVGECAVAVVAIQRVADRNAPIVKITPIDEINILPAVSIEVCYADSRTKLLAIDRDAFIAFKVHKLDARCGSDICELDRTRPCVLGINLRDGACSVEY